MQGLRLCNAHRRGVLSFYAEVFITYNDTWLFSETWNPEIVYDTLITTFCFYKDLLLFSGFLRKICILI